MLSAIHYANLALRFLLELCALAALGLWGYGASENWLLRILLMIGAPLVATVVWGTFVAPKATIIIPVLPRLAIEVAVFAAAGAGLFAVNRPSLAWALLIVYAINRILLFLTSTQ